MSDEWVETTLGELCEMRGGGTPSTKDPSFWGGSVVWLTPTEVVKADGQRISASERTITDAGLASSSAKLLPAGTVLLTTRASVGFTAIADIALTTNQGFQSLIPSDAILPEYLMLWIQGHRDEFISRAGGSTFPEISKTKVASIPITVPPLAVQRRIVDLLAHLDNHLANLQTERVQLRRYVAALADWEWADPLNSGKRIDSLGKVVTGSTPSTKRAEYWDRPLVPFVTPGDLEDLTRVQSVGRFLSREGAAASRIVLEGSVLVVCIGATIGKVGIATAECVTNQQINSIVGLNVSDANYLALVLSASCSQQILVDSAGKTAVPILNKSQFQSVEVPWPDEERRSKLAAQVDTGLNLIAAIDSEMSTLEDLRRSLLGVLLSGSFALGTDYDSFLSEVA